MALDRPHSIAAGIREYLLAPLRLAYGIYAIVLFVALGSCALLAMLLPGVRRRLAPVSSERR